MEVKQQDDGLKGAFYIEESGSRLAQVTYVWAGTDRIIIDHTEVDPVLKGKNAGKEMVLKAVEFARQKHIHIVPLCPFARSVFDKSPELRDVL